MPLKSYMHFYRNPMMVERGRIHMTTRIIAAGSNELNAAEVLHVVRRIVGGSVYIRSMVSANITGHEDTDLYVCALTQRGKMLSLIPPESLVVLDLRPTAEFFIALSHIPAGERVYIFNSNDRFAKLMVKMCRDYHINDIHFEIIAYEDMPAKQVIQKLRQARYIIGVGHLVDKEVLLSPQYSSYLRDDVTIIGCVRMATMVSACELIERMASIEGDCLNNTRLQRQLLNSLAGQFSDTLHAVNGFDASKNKQALTSMLENLETIIKQAVHKESH